MAGLPDMGKMLGPLPLGAWLAVVGGGLGIAVYTRKQSAGAPAAPAIVDDTSGMTGVGTGGTGDWIPTTGPVTAPSTSSDVTVTNNDEWGRAAINFLIASGYDAAVSDAAVRKYLSGGESMSIQEYALIRVALMKIGALPTPLPPPITPIPTVPVPKPPVVKPPVTVPQLWFQGIVSYERDTAGKVWAIKKDGTRLWLAPWQYDALKRPAFVDHYVQPRPPTQAGKAVTPAKAVPAKAAVSKPATRTYLVMPGDNLSKIATKFYGRPDWQRIYNANRNVISNPNVIHAGQRLVIP